MTVKSASYRRFFRNFSLLARRFQVLYSLIVELADPVLIATLQLAAAAVMAAVGWMVQLIVYPAFAAVTSEQWPGHHRRHSQRITWLVAPAMSIELGCALWLAAWSPPGISTATLWGSIMLAGATWLVTAWVAMFHHRVLAASFDELTLRGLLRGNLVRTVCWSAHAVLAAYLVSAVA